MLLNILERPYNVIMSWCHISQRFQLLWALGDEISTQNLVSDFTIQLGRMSILQGIHPKHVCDACPQPTSPPAHTLKKRGMPHKHSVFFSWYGMHNLTTQGKQEQEPGKPWSASGPTSEQVNQRKVGEEAAKMKCYRKWLKNYPVQ